MSDKLQQLHSLLAEQLLNKIKDPDVKASDLNVARQFLKDNGIDAVPTNNNPLEELVKELPFAEKKVVKTN
tara:strand:+ start:1800 stop:2012 length:213 start_codon:yes stop_codon:yes gene_type:complete